MSLLRQRPLVFISSAIGGLEWIRQEIDERLGALRLVDDWVFEIHATSGGEPAEAQYLDVARSCDLMVLIIGQSRSAATAAEYGEAWRDNRDKILPIYLGDDAGQTSGFRDLIDSRHSRAVAATEPELVDQAVAAIERAVRNGRVIMNGLRRLFERSLAALDELLQLEPARSYLPTLTDGFEVFPWVTALDRYPQLVVTAVGGAGKTYGALGALHHLTYVPRLRVKERDEERQPVLDVTIPLYLRATPEAYTVERLLERAFSAVRFYPGVELTAEYSRDGRLALVIDGYDDLSAGAREQLLKSVNFWSQHAPRCRIAFLARALDSRYLPGWERVQPRPLNEGQLVELFETQGRPIRGMIDVPAELSDLIVRPFWANAVARFGLEATSGLELLRRVITHRLEVAASEPLRAAKLREALGELALGVRPATVVAQAEALKQLSDWQQRDGVAARFAAEPAEELLEALRRSGLVDPAASDLAFIHPLLAATLAAEAAAEQSPLPRVIDDDEEVAAFAAALLGDDRYEDLLDLLAARDIFFLARILRLSIDQMREPNLARDIDRYRDALRRLAPLAGPGVDAELRGVEVAAASGLDWTALRHTTDGTAGIHESWEALQKVAGGEIVLWEDDAFTQRSPEVRAAAEIVLSFKRSFNELVPASEPDLDAPSPALPSTRDALIAAVIARVREGAVEERELRGQTGLAGNPRLPTLDGEPRITVATGYGAWIEEEWGAPEPDVVLPSADDENDPDEEFRKAAARLFNKTPRERARDRLRSHTETEIGSALGSAAWNRPTALAGWVW